MTAGYRRGHRPDSLESDGRHERGALITQELPVTNDRETPAPGETDLSPTDPGGGPGWTRRWAHHRAGLIRYVSHILAGDSHTAEDIVQETAIRLWQHPEVLRDDRPLAMWLRTVARNLVVDRTRRRGARPAEFALTSAVDREHTDSELAGVEDAGSVADLLSVLGPRHRRVVYEVYIRDRALADVAIELGIPIGTVKSRCHTALHRLRSATAPPHGGSGVLDRPVGHAERRPDTW